MKITVITGSPHQQGTSSYLADQFIQGAEECGHEVFRFDAAFKRVHPCLGCDRCGVSGNCAQQDDMTELLPRLLDADMVLLATPLYFFGLSAQLKTVVDRFYPLKDILKERSRKAALFVTAHGSDERNMDSVVAQYQTLVKYLRWEDAGMILACGVGARSEIEASDYGDRAYQMGKAYPSLTADE